MYSALLDSSWNSMSPRVVTSLTAVFSRYRVAVIRHVPEIPGKERWGMEEIRSGVASQENIVTRSNYPGPMRERSPEDFWFTAIIFALHRICPRSMGLYFGRELFVKRKS
jgi:hypothetical protein